LAPGFLYSVGMSPPLAAAMLERGVSVQPILYPAVPQKSTRLRFFMSCQHTEAEIDYTAEALVGVMG